MRQRISKTPAAAAVEKMVGKNTPVPLSAPVDKDLLIQDLVGEIKKYVVLSNHAALVMALWVIHTWCAELFSRSPLLLINAPERECGKSQALKIIGKLVRRPIETSNITMASLFRLINKYQTTLTVDEVDTFLGGKEELSGIINAGVERGGVVLRVETHGKELVECAYEVFSPKAMAGIALERHLPPTTMSRGIQIPLKRKTKDDKVARLRSADAGFLTSLHSRMNRFVDDHRDVLSKGWDDLPDELGDREQDNAEPLLAIAHCLGPEWYIKAREAILALCIETAPPQSVSNILLMDIKEVLRKHKGKYITTVALLEGLHFIPEADWSRHNNGGGLTPRQLAKHLASYQIRPKSVRMSDGSSPKGYAVFDFEEAFTRYLPARVDEPLQGDAKPSEPSEERATGLRVELFPIPKI